MNYYKKVDFTVIYIIHNSRLRKNRNVLRIKCMKIICFIFLTPMYYYKNIKTILHFGFDSLFKAFFIDKKILKM